jgi:hypothetical protein
VHGLQPPAPDAPRQRTMSGSAREGWHQSIPGIVHHVSYKSGAPPQGVAGGRLCELVDCAEDRLGEERRLEVHGDDHLPRGIPEAHRTAIAQLVVHGRVVALADHLPPMNSSTPQTVAAVMLVCCQGEPQGRLVVTAGAPQTVRGGGDVERVSACALSVRPQGRTAAPQPLGLG